MSPIAERIERILAEKRLKSARAWSVGAGLTPQYVSTILARARKGEEIDIGVETLHKLAKVAGIDFTWLATGVGNPSGHRGALMTLANWKTLIEEAQHQRPNIAAEYFDKLGTAELPVAIDADWMLIGDLASALQQADQRHTAVSSVHRIGEGRPVREKLRAETRAEQAAAKPRKAKKPA